MVDSTRFRVLSVMNKVCVLVSVTWTMMKSGFCEMQPMIQNNWMERNMTLKGAHSRYKIFGMPLGMDHAWRIGRTRIWRFTLILAPGFVSAIMLDWVKDPQWHSHSSPHLHSQSNLQCIPSLLVRWHGISYVASVQCRLAQLLAPSVVFEDPCFLCCRIYTFPTIGQI